MAGDVDRGSRQYRIAEERSAAGEEEFEIFVAERGQSSSSWHVDSDTRLNLAKHERRVDSDVVLTL